MSSIFNPRPSPHPSILTLAGAVLAVSLPSLCATAAFAGTPAAQAAPAQAPAVDRATAYYHYALAHDYEELATNYGRPEYATRAIEEYKLALNADPTSQFLNNGLAELYFKTGRVRDAIVAAQDLLKKDPNNPDAHKLLGRIYLRSLGGGQGSGPSEQMLHLAIDEYTKIVALEPNSIEDRLLLGQLYSLNHEAAKAEEQFMAAQQIDPGSEEVALTLARLYTERGDLNRAVDLLKALPADDQTSRTELALGATYDQLKDTPNAILAYRRAVDLEPDNLDAARALAQDLYASGQLDEALSVFRDISEGDPEDPSAYVSISEILTRQAKYSDALAVLQKAKALVSDSLKISYNEALLDEALGRYNEAQQILEKMVADSEHTSGQYSEDEKSNRDHFLDSLANLYREQNKTQQAVETYQKLIDLGGEHAVAGYQGQVDTYRDAKQYDKATEIARLAAEKLPKERPIQLMLALQLADTSKPEEGISLAKSLLNNTPSDREVQLTLAQIYSRLRRWSEASEALDKAEAVSARPEDKVYVYFLRGAVFERQKRYDQAEEEFHKVLAIDPNNSATLNYFGYMLADRGVKLNDALTMIQKAVQLDPQDYAYLDSLGWVYFKLGQYTLSEDNLRRASERNPTEPTVHDHLGELYEKTGRLKQAAAQWELALNEYEHSIAADTEPGDVPKIQKKLESARVKLAKESSGAPATTDKP